MKGSTEILLTSPRGVLMEGIASGTIYPGTVVQIKSAVEPINKRYTYEAYAPTKDGWQKPKFIVLPDQSQGRMPTDSYASGARLFLYQPLPGDEFNMLVDASNGALAIGGGLIVDSGTGKLLTVPAATTDYTTGDLDSEAELIAALNTLKNTYREVPFTILETLADPSVDTLVHVLFNGP